ncbi:ribonuclease III [Thiohalobacter sp.]|uniref:ribonuclease III n=1 Tax=Thiohalobacter sp. TaxID=2025948 RepID=UPI002632E78F|nr:ribonuclease III [Thiohalobacter sp.]
MMKDLESLQAKLGYRFGDPDLLDKALTHRSAGRYNYERLEFLGDAALGLVVAAELFERFPDYREGELSRLRASLVRKTTLAELARELELGEHVRLGSGELKSGGYRRDSILADVLEAILGAVYLDGGFEAARTLVLRLYAERFETLPTAAELKDPKTRLQEFLQARQLELPEYNVIAVHGEPHAQTFDVECHIPALGQRVRASGRSRRKAEQQAAAAMLARLEADPAATRA